jgi:glycosyltransferase A (GT-A) superfamily protein (DUF2064 family)
MRSSGSERVLVIMAKAPRPGAVKTRLAPSLSPAAVTAFYCCLLDDTLALARSLGDAEVAIMCPGSDVNELAQLAGSDITVVAQKGEGLAAGLFGVCALQQIVKGTPSTSHHCLQQRQPTPATLFSKTRSKRWPHMMFGPTYDGAYLVGQRLLILRFSQANGHWQSG